MHNSGRVSASHKGNEMADERTELLYVLAVKTDRSFDQLELESRPLCIQALRKWDGSASTLPIYKKSKFTE